MYLFIENSNLLGKGYPPSFLQKLNNIFKRLVRFMFCFDSEWINKVKIVEINNKYIFLEFNNY